MEIEIKRTEDGKYILIVEPKALRQIAIGLGYLTPQTSAEGNLQIEPITIPKKDVAWTWNLYDFIMRSLPSKYLKENWKLLSREHKLKNGIEDGTD